MKRVLLLRHAKAEVDSPTFDDHDRALAARGHADADAIAEAMKSKKLGAELAYCSSAKRTQQTWDHMAAIWGGKSILKVKRDLYLAPPDVILDFICATPDEVSSVVSVGHNPGIEELAMVLDGNWMPPKFSTCAIAVFDFDVESWDQVEPRTGKLVDYFTPSIIREKQS